MPPLITSDFQDDSSFEFLLLDQEERERSRKSVRFSVEKDICEIPHHQDFSHEERRAMWMTADEIREIKQRCKQIVREMIKCGGSTDGEECTRGLEDAYSPKRNQLRRLIFDLVSRNQKHSNGVPMDSDLLALEYGEVCKRSLRRARRKAVRDAREVAC